MLKVFLVEDEVIMRNGIKNNIPWEKEGFEFVGEASDGELAYPLIKKEKPDILITDIKMPFMDGLELSRIVKKEMPQIKIIILSGYNDFEYAKRAISIGVTEYLLKPVGSARLLEVVRAVAETIEKEQENERILERYQKEMEENVQQEKHRLWNALALNQLTTVQLLEWGQRLKIDFTAGAYQVFLFKVSFDGNATASVKELIDLHEQITECSAKWEDALIFDRSPEGWVFLFKGDTPEQVSEWVEEKKTKLTEIVARYPRAEYFGGVGLPVQRMGDIRNSYLEASKAFSGRFFSRKSQIFSYQDPSCEPKEADGKIDVSSLRSQKQENELIEQFLKNGTMEEVKDFLEEYFLEIGEQNYQSLLFRQYLIMSLYFSVSDFLGSQNIEVGSLPEEFQDINQIVRRAVSAGRFREQMQKLFEETIRLRDRHARKKYSALLEEAIAYIEENYQREEMSLHSVSAKVSLSPSYFSAIFSTEMGKTFIEYLTEVRLEKAKELLMCSGLRTAEIGYEVGYKDAHYFSYIFKKVVGCSPKEYKNRRKA